MKKTGINNPEKFDPTHGPRIGTRTVTKQIGRCAASLVVFLISAVEVQAGGAPQINELSDATLARSGRLLIFGSNFGDRQGEVLIDGLSAIATTWTDTEIHAYVPEAATLGSVPVEVTTAKGATDSVTLNVTMRPSGGASSGGQNRIRWRFQLDSQFSGQFITVAPDGTVYATDLFRLYALSPDGGLLWVAVNAGRRRPISLGPDGTIYTAGNLIKAINPDGTMKWEYSSPFGNELLAGPSVGPDGNIYAVQNTLSAGLGAFALDPDGELLFSDPDNPLMASNADSNSAIVFRPDMFYVGIRVSAPAQPVLNAFDFNGDPLWSSISSDRDLNTQTFPKLDPSGRVIARWAQTGMMAINPDGDVDWVSIHPGGGMPTMPGIDATGVIYTGTYLGRKLWAIDPNGSTRWVLPSSGGLTDTVNVAPDGSIILVGGSDTFGQPGWAQAYDTADGTFLWQVDLLSEGGINQYVCSQQPTFTPDSQTAYAATCFLGNVAGYVYAIDTSTEPPPENDIDGDGVGDDVDNCPNHANPDQADCDADGIGDVCAIATGQSTDCDGNGVPDECEIPANDCNGNGSLDICDIANGVSADCNGNNIPDECEDIPNCFNDFCDEATTLCVGTVSGSTTPAGNDGSSSCPFSWAPDVWYAYTAAANGEATFSTCGSPYDTVLSVHTGCPGTEANEIACNDDACGSFDSSITIPVTAGETYLLRVAGFSGQSGDFTLTLEAPTCDPGGPDLVESLPDSFAILAGLLLSGNLEDLFDSDDSRVVVWPSTFAPPSGPEPPVQIEIEATSMTDTPSELRFHYEGHVFMLDSKISTRQRTSLFNYLTQSYDELDNRLAASSDEVFEIVITANPADYVEPGTGRMKALITYKAEGLSGFLFAVANVDQTVWTIAE